MKIVRELLNITQEELADAIEVETLTIKRIENGITRTSKKSLIICKLLGCKQCEDYFKIRVDESDLL